jgi:hypothetical protein
MSSESNGALSRQGVLSRYDKTCTNTRKFTKLIFILGLHTVYIQYSLHIAKLSDSEVSLLLCLSPHDAFPTYTYLHCPMRLLRLGNRFV